METINNENWKYNLHLLVQTSDEFKFIKDFFHATSTKNWQYNDSLKVFQVYKVVEQNTNETEESSNLMLFHGTDEKNVAGILQTGFVNSESGQLGRGVYLTMSSDIASFYTFRKNFVAGKPYFVFVNEVCHSQKLQAVHTTKTLFDDDGLHDVPFIQYRDESSQVTKEEDFKKDRLGRRYRNIEVNVENLHNHYVADSKVVVPRYLISFKGNGESKKLKSKIKFKMSPGFFSILKYELLL